MLTGKTILIACKMIEDEINNVIAKMDNPPEVVWLDRGYHKVPDDLRTKIQEVIDAHDDVDNILLAYGLCGKGTEGLVSQSSRIVIPRFDDCTNMLLCTGQRTSRGLTKPDTMYLTLSWTYDEDAIMNQYEIMKDKYDEETAEEVLSMMFEHYKYVAAIEDGCYDVKQLFEYMNRVQEIIGLEPKVVEGSNCILEQLLCGEWNQNFIILDPGEKLSVDHFNLDLYLRMMQNPTEKLIWECCAN